MFSRDRGRGDSVYRYAHPQVPFRHFRLTDTVVFREHCRRPHPCVEQNGVPLKRILQLERTPRFVRRGYLVVHPVYRLFKHASPGLVVAGELYLPRRPRMYPGGKDKPEAGLRTVHTHTPSPDRNYREDDVEHLHQILPCTHKFELCFCMCTQ